MMIFSCGHDNKDRPDFYGHSISVAGYDRMNERCITHMTVCNGCKTMYELTEEILHTEEQAEQ